MHDSARLHTCVRAGHVNGWTIEPRIRTDHWDKFSCVQALLGRERSPHGASAPTTAKLPVPRAARPPVAQLAESS